MDNSKRVNKYQFFNIEKRNAERDRKEIREREEKEEKDRQKLKKVNSRFNALCLLRQEVVQRR